MFCVTAIISERHLYHFWYGIHYSCSGCYWSPLSLHLDDRLAGLRPLPLASPWRQSSSWRSVWGHYHVEKCHTGQFVKEGDHALIQNVTVHARMEMFMFPFMNHSCPVLQHSCTDHKATSTILDCRQLFWCQDFHSSGHVKQLFYVLLLALCFSGSQQIPVIWRALWWSHKVGFNSNPDPESRFLLPASCLLQSGAETAGSAALSGEPSLPVPIVKLLTLSKGIHIKRNTVLLPYHQTSIKPWSDVFFVPGWEKLFRTIKHSAWRPGFLWPETLETRTPEYVHVSNHKTFLFLDKIKIWLVTGCRYRPSRCREGEDGDSSFAN